MRTLLRFKAFLSVENCRLAHCFGTMLHRGHLQPSSFFAYKTKFSPIMPVSPFNLRTPPPPPLPGLCLDSFNLSALKAQSLGLI